MRAVRARDGDVEVCEVKAAPRAGAVRVRVHSAGICGSDLTLLAAHMLEHTIGHEFAGQLDDGTPVAVQPTTPCGACELCRRGDWQLCATCLGSTLGVYRDGGMADEVWVDAECLVPLPATLALRDACLVEPLAVALHGLERIGLVGGERVAVVGAGSLGLLAGSGARVRGCHVDVVARHAAQRQAADQLGLGLAPEGHYDLVIDAAGSESSLARAVELAAPGGRLLLLGFDWQRIALPGAAVAAKELLIRATMTYGHHGAARDVDAAAALLGRAPEVAASVISHRFPLAEAARAFATARARGAGAIKVVLEP